MSELSQALAQSEWQLSQLQSLSQSQSVEIAQLQELCAQLSNVREMNEVSFCVFHIQRTLVELLFFNTIDMGCVCDLDRICLEEMPFLYYYFLYAFTHSASGLVLTPYALVL